MIRRLSACAVALCLSVLAGGAARAQPAPGACGAGAAQACYLRALEVMDRALAPDRADLALLRQAQALFEDACGRGVADACYFAGRIVGAQTGQITRSLDAGGWRAVDLFHSGCDAARPSGAACSALGFASAYLPQAAPPDSALHHLLKGCDHGSASSCGRAAALLNDWPGASGRIVSWPAAMERRACQGGSPVGCMRVAERLRAMQSGVPRRALTPELARERLRADSSVRAACRDGLPPACTAAGDGYAWDGPGRRLDSAAAYFQLACEGPEDRARDSSWVGDGRGCARRGHLLLRRGRDTAQAIAWFTQGCTLLDSDACADEAYFSYRSGKTDELLALRAVTACNEGSGYGCQVAAELYADPARSEPGRVESHLRRACVLGHGPACTQLGEAMFVDDRAGDAVKLLRRACTLRHGPGCALYGELVGSESDASEQVVRFYELACGYGHAEACWEMTRYVREQGRPVEEGEYRSRACRLSAAYCKQKL